MNPALPVAGLAVGTLIGLTGVGGGSIMAPLLLIIGIDPAVVVGSDLGFGLVTKIVGGSLHLRQSTVSWTWVRRLAIGSVPGVLIGTAAVARLARSPHVLVALVGVVLVISAAAVLSLDVWRRTIRGGRPVMVREDQEPKWTISVAGLAIGMLVGATSVGSGSLVDMALILLSPLAGARLVGTGIVHAVIIGTIASALHWHFRTLDVPLVGALLLGSIPGVLLGSWIANRAPALSLNRAVALLVLISGITTLSHSFSR